MNNQPIDWRNVFAYFRCDLPGEMSRARSYDEAVQILEKLKEKAKQEYKRLVFECHPDRNLGDDNKIKELNAKFDLIKNAKYIPPQPAKHIIIQMHGFGPFGSSTSATTGTTSTSSVYWSTYF